jgi:hypothetical protein
MADNEMMTIVEFSEDISTAEAPEPLPVGEYPATIRAAEVKLSQRGTRYAAVTFHIAPEEFPADYPSDIAPDGKTIVFRRLSMEDNQQARFGLRRFCESIGAPMSKKVDLSEWVGLDAKIEVEHDTYEGVTREQIVRVNEA